MLLVLIVVCLVLTASALDDQPYCALRYRRLCQGKGRHVACQFSAPDPGPSCRNYTLIKFPNDLRQFVVHYINRRRQRIAAGNERVRGGARLPRPEIMMLVNWDRELAQLAQRLADQCQFVHDDCRATVRYPYAGQSVGEVRWRRSSDSDELSAKRAIRRVLDAWWGERRRVQPHQLTAPFKLTPKGTVWGHFSQLAVWTLRAVGCGAVRHGSVYTRMLLVCDFSHTNMLGQRTIAPGPLAPCPMHTIRRRRTAFPLLCATVKRPNPPENHDITEYYEDDMDSVDDVTDRNGVDVKDKIATIKMQETIRIKTEKLIHTNKHEETSKEVDEYSPKTSISARFSNFEKKSTRMIDKLQHELEMNNNEKLVTVVKYQHWVSRRPHFGRLREKVEYTQDQNIPNTSVKQTQADEDFKVYKKFPSKMNYLTNEGADLRQRWKQTRSRPQRPGVNALLNRPPDKLLRRSSLCSLMLDQEDVDQLFRDTGFNVHWRKQSLPR